MEQMDLRTGVFLILSLSAIAHASPGFSQSGLFTVGGDRERTSIMPEYLGDTVRGRVYLNWMNQALWHARTLRFDCSQQIESSKEGRRWTKEIRYSAWMKKENFARIEIRNPDFPGEGSDLIYDGRHMWSYFVGKKSTVYLDRHTVLGTVKNVYMTKDITMGSSLSHDIMNYTAGAMMPVVYLSKFFGYSSALEEEGMAVGFLGRDTVAGEQLLHILLVMLDGQRMAEYWISERDSLPRYMQEKLVMNGSDYFLKRERWIHVAVDDDLPDSLFAWEPPDNWKEYSPPAEQILQDSLLRMRGNLYDTFSGLSILGGGTFAAGDYKGRVVLLVFWRLGCPPCRKEMAAMQKLHDQYRELGVTVVGFNHVDNEALVRQYLEKNEISYPVILDGTDYAGTVYHSFKTNIVPLTCLIDRNGYLVSAWYGFDPNEKKAEHILESLPDLRSVPEK